MTPNEARDEMLTVFKDAWTTAGYSVVNSVVWTDVGGAPPITERPWARVTLRHNDGHQASLAGSNEQKKYTASGTLWVQLFCPIAQGDTPGYDLVHAILSAYRAARGAVWYKNHRLREGGSSGAFAQITGLVDFEYDHHSL